MEAIDIAARAKSYFKILRKQIFLYISDHLKTKFNKFQVYLTISGLVFLFFFTSVIVHKKVTQAVLPISRPSSDYRVLFSTVSTLPTQTLPTQYLPVSSGGEMEAIDIAARAKSYFQTLKNEHSYTFLTISIPSLLNVKSLQQKLDAKEEWRQ